MSRPVSLSGMSFEEYAALPGVNFSTLKDMRRSPLHYHHRLTTPRDDTPRMGMGRAVHTAVLEPDRFMLEYAVWSGPRRAGKDYEAFVLANPGRTILRVDEYERCLAIRDAVRADKDARRVLRRGKPEIVLKWIDPETRLRCKARLDWLDRGALTDVKTTADIDAFTFGRLAGRMAYHAQLAFYRAGLDALGHPDAPVRILAVEAEPPHDVGVFRLPDEALDAGRDLVDELLAKVRRHRRARRWPGRYSGEQVLELAPWDLTDSDDELELVGLK